MVKKSKKNRSKGDLKKGPLSLKKSADKEADRWINKIIFPRVRAWHLILFIVVLAVLIFAKTAYTPAQSDDGVRVYDGEKVKVEFYVMSQCPYGTQVVDAIAPVMKDMGDSVDLHIDYIVSEIAEGDFKSLHGEPEVFGDKIQLCAMKYAPEDYMDFIVCQNKNAGAIPGNWESCADEVGLDKKVLRECYDGEESDNLLSESAKRAQERQARGSPTIFVNDKPYSGQRDSLSLQRAICQNLEEDVPACDDIPACATDFDCMPDEGKIAVCENPGDNSARCVQKDPVKFEMIVLNSEECTDCDPSQVIAVSKNLFAGVSERVVDISSEEGKKLVDELGVTVAPAFIFEKTLLESQGWKNNPNVQGAFEDKGEYLKLRDEATGASFMIDESARDALLETIGVVKGDNLPQIDFFVMSYCPYGNQAEELIEKVYNNLGDEAKFVPHYVIYSNYQGGGPDFCFDEESKYCSMHGIVELHQDLREMCVYNHMGIQEWFKFALAMNSKCTASNADECWEGVAKDLGIDMSVVETCFEDESLDILESELALNKALKVSGSPTIFVEGVSYKGARDPNTIQKSLCDGFESKPSACAKVIGGAAPVTSGSC